MPLREDLKNFIPKFLWTTINHPQGYIVSAEEFNSQWNLNVAQGDHTALTVQQLLTMLYETILSDTEGAIHLFTQIPGVTATNVRAALLELRQWMDAEQVRVNGQVARLDNVDAGLQTQVTNNLNAFNTHKTSADHDGRYFTEAEVTAIQGALQGQINTNGAQIVTLQNALAALDDTFSTDAERVAAIVNVINQFQIADDDLEALIVGKADKTAVYTKAEIDNMTLGSYKFGFFRNTVTVTADNQVIPVGISEWNPEDDPLMVYVGGLYQTPGVDYTVDTVNKTVTGAWLIDYVVDFFVVKNVRVVEPGDYIDGYLLSADSVQRTALVPAMRAELDGLRSDVNGLQTKAEFEFGNDTFASGLTHTVTNAFITADTFVNVIPTMEKAGTWSVVSSEGSFTITSDSAETAVTFEWNAIKKGTV